MDPYRDPDDAARATAAGLTAAQHGALATLRDGAPLVTRVACLWVPGRGPSLLVSDLSDHARALAADPACSILLGDPGERGDPLTHPRLTVSGRAVEDDKAALRTAWAAERPKTRLYYDFTDFRVWRIEVADALLNAGFGRAYRLAASDLP
ncbi:pyridoxamine 5'-phosphate oxidase family protein [Jannaschia sp. LMIT008]|uniref:pyridoxamine 5'-phosphate oxidase family protein n=1 Tax=Jannaschia maritima TaxID=3032585 RepID=UPI0028112872|nr:pyridoxamine 5'-phosphate oxidase family protein [Jannaschia sp. LMIT008]